MFKDRYLWPDGGFGGWFLPKKPIGWDACIRRLLDLAETRTLAVMCAEDLPGKCHRGVEITQDRRVTISGY